MNLPVERVLALAGKIEHGDGTVRLVAPLTVAELIDLEAVLRAYPVMCSDLSKWQALAERSIALGESLQRKWDAVANARPVCLLENVPGHYVVTWDEEVMLAAPQGICQLIVKPLA